MTLSFILVPPLLTSFTIAGLCFTLTRSIRRTIFSATWLSSLLPILAALVLYRLLPYYADFYYVVIYSLFLLSYLLLRVFFAREVLQNPDIFKRPNQIRRSGVNAFFTLVLLTISLLGLYCLVHMVHDRSYPWNPAYQHVNRMDTHPVNS